MGRRIKVDGRNYVKHLAMKAENTTREENMKQSYDTARKLVGKYREPERQVKYKEDKPITEIQD